MNGPVLSMMLEGAANTSYAIVYGFDTSLIMFSRSQ